MKIVVSAPGKIHLLGEHVVVYGKPALIAAIDKRLYAKIKIKDQKSKIKNKEIDIKTDSDSHLIEKAVTIFKDKFRIKNLPSLEISISSQIPVGSGLGSSAALAVALIGVLMKGILNIWNPVKINELAYEVEKLQHGNPSGGDNTAVTFGGLLWYRREFEFLKSIWSLPITNYKIPPFFLIDSGRPNETTGEMVSSVRKVAADNPEEFEKVCNTQEKETKSLLLALKNGDKEMMKQAIRKGERNLEKIRVVGKYAKKIIGEIDKLDGAAKISGGGGLVLGSGFLLCYHDDFSKLKEIEKSNGVVIQKVKLGGEGVRIEQCQK